MTPYLPHLRRSHPVALAAACLAAVALAADAEASSVPVVGQEPGTAADAGSAVACVGPAAGPARLDPTEVTMTSSGRAPGASGVLRLRIASSPVGLALAEDGSYRYEVRVRAEGLRGRPGTHHVVWAATPELDRHVRIGTLGEDGSASGEVDWNKFLVFVTAEKRPDPSSWSQRILLSATSPSGRMHTMAGHGPFSGEPCLDPRP